MVTKVFGIFDVKAKNYGQPFFMSHSGLALRSFSDLVEDQKSTLNKHPADFKLYCLGEYDDCSGAFKSINPEFLANASDFIKA